MPVDGNVRRAKLLSRAKRLVRPMVPPALLEAKARLRPEAVLENPYVTGKLLGPPRGDVIIPWPERPAAVGDELPVPPPSLWEGYGTNEAEYLMSGREHTDAMIAILGEAGVSAEDLGRVLELGCAAGRMLRFFPRSSDSEVWGTDIKADTIAWCQQHLSPPMLFAATTTAPHLPFEDNYFDLVYCGSVFTHIIDLPDAWLLELRRVTKKGGYGYVTIFDKHCLQLVLARSEGDPLFGWFVRVLREFDERTSVFSQNFACFSVDAGPTWRGMPVPQVCYDIDYLTERWSRVVDLISVNQEAYGDQTAVLFRK